MIVNTFIIMKLTLFSSQQNSSLEQLSSPPFDLLALTHHASICRIVNEIQIIEKANIWIVS